MKKIAYAYIFVAIITGLIIAGLYIWSLPDGRLHVTFCNVGQGDAAYIRFPDGRDMLIDGGPDTKVLSCLGKKLPFWDRTLDLVVMTHPQKDHLGGLVPVFERYRVIHFIRSDVENTEADIYKALQTAVKQSGATVHKVTAGQTVDISGVRLNVLWPTTGQLAQMHPGGGSDVLGAVSGDLNDASVVLHMAYGKFDAVFAGDADSHVNGEFAGLMPTGDALEVLKVPHHGSKTGMTQGFLDRLTPELAVISVGKNSYGHPAKETLDLLKKYKSRVLRTDEIGDIEISSDGRSWNVLTQEN